MADPLVCYQSWNRCPKYADGAHRLLNIGRVEAMYGDSWTCACGAVGLVNTDEHAARYRQPCTCPSYYAVHLAGCPRYRPPIRQPLDSSSGT